MMGSLVERYVLHPDAIEALSLARVEQAVGDLGRWTPAERALVLRMVYACGDPSLAPLIRMSPEAVAAGLTAIRGGRPIVADVRMVAVAIDQRRAGKFSSIIWCAIDDSRVAEAARLRGVPRAVAAMDRAVPVADGGIVVIGNAPTALLALLDLIDAGRVKPALVIGTPVGFVAAAESKDELIRRAVPHITVAGTRGGSAVAAAAVNALLRLAEQHESGEAGEL